MPPSARSLIHPPCPTVLLRHELPAGRGESHWDWMISPSPAGAASNPLPLLTFRLDERPDRLAPDQSVLARRLPDHRAAYLEYEGPISGDRGRVHRDRSGTVVRGGLDVSEGGEMLIHWDRPRTETALRLIPGEGDFWRLICLASESILR